MATDISRRRLLALGAGTAGAAAAGSLLPPSLQAALAAEPPPGGMDAIRHVVILMQENRSFDHYFGTLRGVRGFGDRNAITLPHGRPVFEQPGLLGLGHVLPFPVRDAAEAQKKDLQYIGDLDHSWDGGAVAWNNGWSDRWVTAKSAATMAYYDRRDVPLHYELADTFTVCDAYHSAIHSSTSPNRNHLVSGWTGYEPNGKRAVGNDAYDEDRHTGYTWTTYAERLEKAGRTWKTYQEWDNFQDNNLEFFATFKAVARKALSRAGDFRNTEAFYARVRNAATPEAERRRLLGLLEEGVAALDPAERSLFQRGLRRGETGGLAAEFRSDVAAGRLPEVSYLVPSAADSEHPGASSPVASATLVNQVLDALASHPDVWRHTVVLLTYDENDGFFDHVPPPVPPRGETDEIWGGRPTGLGVRVPLLVISPWTVGGYVCSEVFDHTSLVRFLERWTGVEEPNITPWRRRVTGDLTSAFDFRRGRPQPELDRPAPIPPFTGRWRPEPPSEQQMPVQEPGRRRARPLPYQPDAHGRVDGRSVRLLLVNTGRRSAHFALYPYAGEFPAPQHRDVKGIAGWEVPVVGEEYRFTLTGPNGFRREFAGRLADGADGADGGHGRDGADEGLGAGAGHGAGAAAAEVATRIDPRDRDVHLTLANRGTTPLTFTVRPTGYVDEADLGDWTREIVVKPGRSRSVVHSAADAHGWYDLTVAIAEDPAFHRRLMGHIENGRESVSG
ncbi:phosphocholine-specific phospholipase C [Streptomyces sp. NPDC047108]|uniref:phosphocholine-specific phospholipase C n=1 Tax=Streptomyces sp. NPDC047108 TaxID=3155025 RepID=UPI00340EB21C